MPMKMAPFGVMVSSPSGGSTRRHRRGEGLRIEPGEALEGRPELGALVGDARLHRRMVRVDHGPEVDRPGPHAAGDLVELAPELAVLGAGTPLSHIGPGHSSSRSASTGCTTDRRCPTLAIGTRCAFRRRKLTRQAAAGIRPLWPAQDGRITARSPWVFAVPPMIQSVCASRSVLGGPFASTGVEDAALSSEPTVALRASVRRHRSHLER